MTVPAPNLLDLTPERAQSFETATDGRVTVLVPRIRYAWLARVLTRLAARPIRVRLDEMGSFVWTQCDGATSVGTIAARVRERFGGEDDAALARTVQFVRTMVKGDLVILTGPRAVRPGGPFPQGDDGWQAR